MANDVLEFSIVGAVAGEPAEMILHFEGDAANAGDPVTLAQQAIPAIQTVWQADLMAALPDDFVLAGYKARRVNNTGGPTAALPVAGINGGRGANSVSSGQGPVLILNYFDSVGVPNRWRTGRIFLPGIADGDLVQNVLQAGLEGALTTLLTHVGASTAADAGGHVWTHKVWSRKNLRVFTINGRIASGVIGTQRRRLHPAL